MLHLDATSPTEVPKDSPADSVPCFNLWATDHVDSDDAAAPSLAMASMALNPRNLSAFLARCLSPPAIPVAQSP